MAEGFNLQAKSETGWIYLPHHGFRFSILSGQTTLFNQWWTNIQLGWNGPPPILRRRPTCWYSINRLTRWRHQSSSAETAEGSATFWQLAACCVSRTMGDDDVTWPAYKNYRASIFVLTGTVRRVVASLNTSMARTRIGRPLPDSIHHSDATAGTASTLPCHLYINAYD